MIKTWPEVLTRYQALRPTSRASKNLNEWGEILASAYRLDANKANELWQQLIDLNIRADLSYAKYFVSQIFNKITDHLKLHESAEFLYMNPERVKLLLTHGYSIDANNFFDYCILGHNIINGNFSAVFTLLELFNKNDQPDVSLGDSTAVCLRLFSATTSLLNPRGEAWLKEYSEVPTDKVVRLYRMCEKKYPGSLLGNIAFVYRLMATSEVEKDLSLVLTLLDVCKTYSPALVTDFLYHERDIVPRSTALKILVKHAEENHSLPMKVSGDTSSKNKAKARWFRNFFRKSEQIRDAILMRTFGWLQDEEEYYLDKLAEQGNWNKWIEILSYMILLGNSSFSRSGASYVKNCIECCKPPIVLDHGGYSITVTVSNSVDDIFCEFTSEQKVGFAKALIMLCCAIQLSDEFDGVYRKASEFILKNNEVLDAINNMMPLRLLHENLTKESLCEFGNLLLDREPALKEKISCHVSQKDAALKQEEQLRQEEFQKRASNLYESMLYSSPYKVLNSAFMKLPEISEHFAIMMDGVLNELVTYLKGKQLDLSTFICSTKGYCSVYLTDEHGNIESKNIMLVNRTDEEFSEYVLRYTEAIYREKINYSRVNYPAVPSPNQKAKCYSPRHGKKVYYRCVNEDDQPSLVKHDANIYKQVQRIASAAVNRYFEEHPSLLVSLKASYGYRPKKANL